MCWYITSSLISCAWARTKGRLAVAIGKRVLDAAPHDAVHLLLDVFRQRAIDDDAAERNRGAGFGFPELAEVDDLLQALRGVGEAVLVNDQAGVERPVEHAHLRSRRRAARSCRSPPGNASDSRKFAVVYLPGIAIFRLAARHFVARDRRASRSAAVRSSVRARCRHRAARSCRCSRRRRGSSTW